MPARKRGRDEMEVEEPAATQSTGLLARIRSTWQLANIMQFIYLFGQAFKIEEDFDMEDLEEECLKPGPSQRLADIGLRLLKHISSHRGLTPELFDEYTRRQYMVRRPENNPFGQDQQPNRFAEFDIFTKLRVLHQLTVWTLSNPDRFREKMVETKESEQTGWRIEEFGWDSEERIYFLLDDNRLYRRTPKSLPSPPPPKIASQSKARSRQKGSRSSKRRRTAASEEPEDMEEEEVQRDSELYEEFPDEGFGGDKWECLCVNLQDYQTFLEGLRKSRDPNEKALYKRVAQDVLPVIEKSEEERAKKLAKRQRELVTLEKMATAKRSSRLASKFEREKEEEAAREAEKKRQIDLAAARKDAQRQKDMDNDRMSRMMTREQRLKDREYKRILHEEELQRLAEEQKRIEKGEIEAKKSERQLKAEMKRKQEELAELAQEKDWVFDCSGCGTHGQNIDDGKHSLACERCNVWQHSACLGLSVDEADKDDFHFVCRDCKRREDDAKKPKLPTLKFRLGPSKSSQHPEANEALATAASSRPTDRARVVIENPTKKHKRKSSETDRQVNGLPPMKNFKPYKQQQTLQSAAEESSIHHTFMHGPTLSPLGQVQSPVNGTRPPGLVSPQRSTHQPNGYPPPQHREPMQFGPPLHASASAQQPHSNGHSHHKQGSVPRTPAQHDPFRNSFSSNPPGSSHSRTSPCPNRSTFLPSLSRMPPPQTTPNSSFNANSSFSNPYPLPSTPAQSISVAQKQMTAAPAPAPGAVLQASSPPMAPPFRPDAAIAGISPVKNSPPRPLSRQGVSDIGGTPVVPPMQKLVPSPNTNERTNGMNGLGSPVKSPTPLTTLSRPER